MFGVCVSVYQHRVHVSSFQLVSEEGQKIGRLPEIRRSCDDQKHQTEEMFSQRWPCLNKTVNQYTGTFYTLFLFVH